VVDGEPGEIQSEAVKTRTSKFAVAAVVMLAVVVLFNVACLAAAFGLIAFIGQIAQDTPLVDVWWIRNILARVMPDIRAGAGLDTILPQLWSWAGGTLWLWAVLETAGYVAFALWLYRVHRELRERAGTSLRFASHWAITGFFVPVFNLFRPFQVAREVYRASDAPARPPWVRWWWEFFLLRGYFTVMSYRLLTEVFPEAVGTLIGWHLFCVLAAMFAIAVVRAVQRAMAAPVPQVPAAALTVKKVSAPVWWDVVFVGAIFVAIPLVFGKHQMERRLGAMEQAIKERTQARAEDQSSAAPVTPSDGVPPAPPVAAPAPRENLVIAWAEMSKRLIHRVDPVYPPDVKVDQQMTVTLKAEITVDGRVKRLTFLAPVPEAFAEAATEAVMQWRFEPFLLDGRPVPVATTITLIFAPRPGTNSE
jgi:outer membrane biosynthesis protein TonB